MDGTGDLERVLRPSGALLAAHTAVGRAIEDLAVARTPHDPTTLDLLLRLRLAPERRMRGIDLCRQLLKSPSHISRLLDRAERQGLVERRQDPRDGRAHLVSLTPEGQAAVEGFVPHLVSVLRGVVHETLSEAEQDTLVELLGRLTRASRRLIDGADADDDRLR